MLTKWETIWNVKQFTNSSCPSLHSLLDFVHADKEPKLEIFPIQDVQRKPIGKSLILTCRANVPDSDLISDLRWRGQDNMPIPPKQ